MKKLITIILILAMLLPAAASAASYVYDVYNHFIDGNYYNRTFGSGFDFDSMLFELIVMSDERTAYWSKQSWTDGIRSATDVIECKFSSNGSTFTISFPDGTEFDGFYDQDGNGVWVCLGSNTYFRFSPVHSYDAVEDYKRP